MIKCAGADADSFLLFSFFLLCVFLFELPQLASTTNALLPPSPEHPTNYQLL